MIEINNINCLLSLGYPEFGKHLNETGRPIVYSCSWPAYWGDKIPNYPAIAKSCNLWRNYGDIQDSYDDVLDIVDHYGDHQDEFAQKLLERNGGLAAAISTKINIAHQDKYYTDTEAMEQSFKSRGLA